MRNVLKLSADDCCPDETSVLQAQGIPIESETASRIKAMMQNALKSFEELAQPAGLIADISVSDFVDVYSGEGNNAPQSPVADIYPQANYLALFVVTLGDIVCQKINELFNDRSFAEGLMLDTVASEAADRLAQFIQEHFLRSCIKDETSIERSATQRYSPGYCDWHISGQRKLFEYLQPVEIGVTLNQSYLMQPIKSVSGVLIVGKEDIFNVDMSYPCCNDCRDQSCISRIVSKIQN